MERKDKVAIVFGGTSGIGCATALALAQGGAHVIAVGRSERRVAEMSERLSLRGRAVAGDGTDERFVRGLLADTAPDLVIVALGTQPVLAPIEAQSWESFSVAWEADTKATLCIGQAALRSPLRPGSAVVIISSGAAINGSPLSGGYAGAKRMQWLLAGYLRKRAADLGLGIGFHVVIPGQLVVGTEMGEAAAAAYGEGQGGRDGFLARWPAPLTPEGVAAGILAVLEPSRASVLAHVVDGQGLKAMP